MAFVPRNVVTLTPRAFRLPTRRNREARKRIEQVVLERYRPRFESDPERIELDFPKRMGGRAAKNVLPPPAASGPRREPPKHRTPVRSRTA
jgi:hypothetical protein